MSDITLPNVIPDQAVERNFQELVDQLNDKIEALERELSSITETGLVPLPGYLDGFRLSYTTTTEIKATPGFCRDSTNNYWIKTDSTLVLNSSKSGAGGLDTGSLTGSVWYHIYVIDGPKVSPKLIMSLAPADATRLGNQDNSPVLPDGYTHYRRIGSNRVNSSLQFLDFRQVGTGRSREIIWEGDPETVRWINGGPGTTIRTPYSVGRVPPQCRRARISLGHQPASISNLLEIHSPLGTGNQSRNILLRSWATTGSVSYHGTQIVHPVNSTLDVQAAGSSDKLYSAVYSYWDEL